MKIQAFQAIVPNLSKINISEKFFDAVRTKYPDYEKNGMFHSLDSKAIFLYEIASPSGLFHGVVAALDIEEYNKEKVKKHEKTLYEKERQQMALLMERGAMVKPVLLAHHSVASLHDFIEENTKDKTPFYSIFFEENKEKHTFWQLSEEEKINEIQAIFEKEIPNVYVADGHHRLSTNALLHKTMNNEGEGHFYDQLLCAFFASNELRIAPFNRVVTADVPDFIEKVKAFATLTLTADFLPKEKYSFAVFYSQKWYFFTWKKEVVGDFAQNKKVVLDVDLLNEKILKGILQIEDIRKDKRIIYVEGTKGHDALEKNCASDNTIAFSLYPVDIQDLMSVSDAGDVMPPKSTWFEPRMKNGLLVQAISHL